MTETNTVTPKTTTTEQPDILGNTCQQILNASVDECLAKAIALVNNRGLNDFTLGGILERAHHENWHLKLGFDTFKEMVSAKFEMQERKAQYLRNIYVNLVNAKVTWEQVSPIGWSKLREICDRITLDNVEQWVDICSDMTVNQLKEYLKALDKNPDGDDAELAKPEMKTTSDVKNVSFKLHSDQSELVTSALDTVKQEHNIKHDNEALAALCTLALSGPTAPATSQEVSKEDLIANLTPAEITNALGQVGLLNLLNTLSAEVLVNLLKVKGLETTLDLVDTAYPDITIEVQVPDGYLP